MTRAAPYTDGMSSKSRTYTVSAYVRMSVFEQLSKPGRKWISLWPH